MIIEFILGAGSLILQVIDKGFACNKAKKAKISEDLFEISEILGRIAVDLERDICPFTECSAMSTITESLLEKIRGSVDPELVVQLEEALSHFSEVDQLHACENRKETAVNLKNAAGRFLAASMLAKY